MQDFDQQFMSLYQAFSLLLSAGSLLMFLIGAIVVFMSGRPSTERTLIGIGALLHLVSIVVSLAMSLVQRSGLQGAQSMRLMFLFYGISALLSFAGTAMGLLGAIKLLKRTNHLELLLQDSDDDR